MCQKIASFSEIDATSADIDLDGIKILVMLCLLAWFLIMQWKLLRSEIIT